ncbi:MAG: cohesin domain-containing protein [Candidatus Cloacimonadota bacterium]|nr:cohesin domain-containing protein [Candidatus Cloacimonadota bacterium]
MRKYLPAILIIILILLTACSEESTEPQTNLKLKISPSEQTIAINEPATFSVKIENVTDLFAVSGEITFDNTMIELPENPVTKGEFWNGEPLLEYINESGCLNICIGLIQTENDDGIGGDGILFYFTVKGIDVGENIFTIENLKLINENGGQVLGFDDIEVSYANLIVGN